MPRDLDLSANGLHDDIAGRLGENTTLDREAVEGLKNLSPESHDALLIASMFVDTLGYAHIASSHMIAKSIERQTEAIEELTNAVRLLGHTGS